jgi:hypothetical protein
MPHFGLMEEKKLGPVAGPFQRSRLHLRAARRRLREGKTAAGIVTLYDSLSAAMDSYSGSGSRTGGLDIRNGEDIKQERVLYRVLVRSGVIKSDLDFEAFEDLMEKALGQELPGYDHRVVLRQVESLLEQLGVMPFDEASLPPEPPGTF